MRCLWIMFVTAVCFLFLQKLYFCNPVSIWYKAKTYTFNSSQTMLNIRPTFLDFADWADFRTCPSSTVAGDQPNNRFKQLQQLHWNLRYKKGIQRSTYLRITIYILLTCTCIKEKPSCQKHSVKLIGFWPWDRASLHKSLLLPLPLPIEIVV